MEDRLAPGLYLERLDGPLAPYLAERVPAVVGVGDDRVAGVTWWENVCRDRTDLPRRLPERDHLVVYEVAAGFRAPDPPPEIEAHHFVRTPRPGQGRLTGRPTLGLSLVLISPRAPEQAQAQALRDWADFVHLRHIAEAAVPGYTMITPYENAGGGDPRFLHLYEMDTEDAETAFQTMTPLVAERLGGRDTDEFAAWAMTPELQIWYVNSFRRLGEMRP